MAVPKTQYKNWVWLLLFEVGRKRVRTRKVVPVSGARR